MTFNISSYIFALREDTLVRKYKENEFSFGILLTYSYLCARYAQCWARITKNDMEIQRGSIFLIS